MNRDDCKKLYELVKSLPDLNQDGYKIIEISEKMLACGEDIAISTVYSEGWVRYLVDKYNMFVVWDDYNGYCIIKK